MFEPARRLTLRRLALRSAATGATLAWPWRAHAETGHLEQIKARGSLSVALYDDMPPFSNKGVGVDVSLATAIAAELGVKVALLPFPGGEQMADDLRNMVWKGHYLGYGPADLMLHVPVDRPLMVANPQVRIFAPYYRERVRMARDVAALPNLPDLSALKGKEVAVSGQSLPGLLLMGAEGGAYQKQLHTHFQDGVGAAQALQRGEVQAAAGLQSELESVLAGDPRYAIDALPVPQPPIDGWVVGCAVRKDATALSEAVQAAINRLAESGQIKAMFKAAGLSWRPV